MKKIANKFFWLLLLAAAFFASCEDFTLPKDGDWTRELVVGSKDEGEIDEGSFVGIRFNIPSNECSITVGNKIWFETSVTGDIVRAPEFSWTLFDETNPDGTELERGGENVPILFEALSPGRKSIVFRVSAENGAAEKTLVVNVLAKPETNTLFYFDYGKWRNENTPAGGTYTVPRGRKLVISPVRHFRQLTDTTQYEWALDGIVQVQDVLFPTYFVFAAEEEPGTEHTITVYARDSNRYGRYAAALETKIKITEPEGRYKRPPTATSSFIAEKVFEFTPGPGQFIRDDGTGFPPIVFAPGITEAEVAAQAEEFLNQSVNVPNFTYGGAVSLGSWGGYLVTGFDHSVDNIPGAYSFSIEGNPLGVWSEPGIVWVSQDENGDGLVNDTWFELRGSETGREGTVQLYSVTYHKPDSSAGLVWEDNTGGHGALPYLSFYKLVMGFPYQTGGDTVTFTGSSLISHLYITGSPDHPPNLVTHPSYPYGYVDNIGQITDFRISDAMQLDGTPANLAYIDFVKVQCAVFEWTGGLGEISTETGLPVDYQLTH